MPHWINTYLLKTTNSHHPGCRGILFLLMIPRDPTWSEDTIILTFILQSTLKTPYTNHSYYFIITFLLIKFINPKGVLWLQIKLLISVWIDKLNDTWFCLPHPWSLPEAAGQSVRLAAKPYSGFPSLNSSFSTIEIYQVSLHIGKDVRFRDACVWWVWKAFHHH